MPSAVRNVSGLPGATTLRCLARKVLFTVAALADCEELGCLFRSNRAFTHAHRCEQRSNLENANKYEYPSGTLRVHQGTKNRWRNSQADIHS